MDLSDKISLFSGRHYDGGGITIYLFIGDRDLRYITCVSFLIANRSFNCTDLVFFFVNNFGVLPFRVS